jgi:hypothetical protein
MNFNQRSIRLREESRCMIDEVQDVAKVMIEQIVKDAFASHYPDIEKTKLKTHIRILKRNTLTTELEYFFPKNMLNVKSSQVEIVEKNEQANGMLLKVVTPHQTFGVYVNVSAPGITFELTTSSEGRVAIATKHAIDQSEKPSLVLTRIEPYICTCCNAYCVRKCELCWETLGISVRYCSKYCQKMDYRLHKRVCGKTM